MRPIILTVSLALALIMAPGVFAAPGDLINYPRGFDVSAYVGSVIQEPNPSGYFEPSGEYSIISGFEIVLDPGDAQENFTIITDLYNVTGNLTRETWAGIPYRRLYWVFQDIEGRNETVNEIRFGGLVMAWGITKGTLHLTRGDEVTKTKYPNPSYILVNYTGQGYFYIHVMQSAGQVELIKATQGGASYALQQYLYTMGEVAQEAGSISADVFNRLIKAALPDEWEGPYDSLLQWVTTMLKVVIFMATSIALMVMTIITIALIHGVAKTSNMRGPRRITRMTEIVLQDTGKMLGMYIGFILAFFRVIIETMRTFINALRG